MDSVKIEWDEFGNEVCIRDYGHYIIISKRCLIDNSVGYRLFLNNLSKYLDRLYRRIISLLELQCLG